VVDYLALGREVAIPVNVVAELDRDVSEYVVDDDIRDRRGGRGVTFRRR
jgi:hypothetical protein